MFRPWRTVRKLGEVRTLGNSRSYFVILYEETGVIVPLDAFRSDFSSQIFRAAADQWHNKARGTEAP